MSLPSTAPPWATPPSHSTAPAHTPKPRQRIWDELSTYLPGLLMAFLAMTAYWLLRAMPEPAPTDQAQQAYAEPGYFMRQFALKTFAPSGALQTEIAGTHAQYHPKTDSIEISQARITHTQAPGPTTTASAQRLISNAKQTEFWLRGNVIVIRQPSTPTRPHLPADPIAFYGEQLNILTDPQRFISTQPITIKRGKDLITANSIQYNANDDIIELKGQVKAYIENRAQ